MVNAEKHKTIRNIGGMLPIEDKAKMHELAKNLINTINDNPKVIVDALESFHLELTNYYNSFDETTAGVLKIGTCKRILELYENTFFIKNTIHYNYHMLRIDADCIKTLLSECDGVIDEFKNVQSRQNKNIDNKTYGGFYSVVASESIDNDADYPLENFESIIRLQEPINLVGADGLLY